MYQKKHTQFKSVLKVLKLSILVVFIIITRRNHIVLYILINFDLFEQRNIFLRKNITLFFLLKIYV